MVERPKDILFLQLTIIQVDYLAFTLENLGTTYFHSWSCHLTYISFHSTPKVLGEDK